MSLAAVDVVLVTLDWAIVNGTAWVAELVGPVLTASGEVTYSTLVPGQGPWTFTAPPGRQDSTPPGCISRRSF